MIMYFATLDCATARLRDFKPAPEQFTMNTSSERGWPACVVIGSILVQDEMGSSHNRGFYPVTQQFDVFPPLAETLIRERTSAPGWGQHTFGKSYRYKRLLHSVTSRQGRIVGRQTYSARPVRSDSSMEPTWYRMRPCTIDRRAPR